MHDTRAEDPITTVTSHNDMVVLAREMPEMLPAVSIDANAPAAPFSEAVALFLHAGLDSPATRRAYGRHLRSAGLVFNDMPVAELTGGDLAEFRASIMDSGLAPASMAQALSALRSFLTWSGSLGAHRLPGEAIRAALRTPRAVVQTRYTVITEREISLMLSAATTARGKAILGLLLGAGLRAAEVASLRIEDVIEDSEGGMAVFVNQGKGRRDRTVPIGPEVDALVRDYLVDSGRHLGSSGRLFLATDRGASKRDVAGLTTRTLSRLVVEIALAAGIAAKRVTPHSLRHTYAIRCLRAGGNVVAVAKLLGHSSIATTQRYVDHLAVSELRSTVPSLPMPAVDELAS